jgi:hypothetical protein
LSDDIVWDDPSHGVVWDDNDQHEKARALVHSGQESYFPDMATAAGKQLVALARKGANLLNIGGSAGPTNPGDPDVHDPTAFGSIENIKAAEQEAKEAAAKPGGRFGQIVADTAGTAPIGGPIEGIGASVLGKSLLARIATRAGSGAAIGAAGSDPGERVTGAETGGVLGSSLGALQELGGRLLSGVVKKSAPLQLLESDVARSNALPGASQRNLFVPVSQGADPDDIVSSIIGKGYQGGLSYVPGVEAQLNSQARKAGDTLRGAMLQLSAPEGHVVPGQAVEDMQLSTKQVQDAYDELYGKLRQVNNISIPNDFNDQLKTKIQAADPQIPESAVDAHVGAVRAILDTQAENSKDGMINGWNLKNVRDNVQGMNIDTPMAQRDGLINTTKDYIDDLFSNKLKQSFNLNQQKTQDILTAYKSNAPNYENFRPLKEAVNAASADSGRFTFGSVARRANDFTDSEGIDQSAKAVLGQPAAKLNQAQRIVGYSAIPLAERFLGPYYTGGILGGANLAATKTFQRGLYGDTALQGALRELATRNPRLAASLGYAARNAVTSDVGEE